MCTISADIRLLLTIALAPLDPIRTKHSHVVITETLSNVYMKIDSIIPAEQETFAHFSLLGVQFLTHHHWLEETIICVSYLISYLLQMASN